MIVTTIISWNVVGVYGEGRRWTIDELTSKSFKCWIFDHMLGWYLSCRSKCRGINSRAWNQCEIKAYGLITSDSWDDFELSISGRRPRPSDGQKGNIPTPADADVIFEEKYKSKLELKRLVIQLFGLEELPCEFRCNSAGITFSKGANMAISKGKVRSELCEGRMSKMKFLELQTSFNYSGRGAALEVSRGWSSSYRKTTHMSISNDSFIMHGRYFFCKSVMIIVCYLFPSRP